MADHLDSASARTSRKTDITDIYAFHPPGSGSPASQDLGRMVLVLNVNPLTKPNPRRLLFSPDGRYQLKIDNDGDVRANIVFDISFSRPDSDGFQGLTVKKNGAPFISGRTGVLISSDLENARLFAGTRDDPFFFDLEAFLGVNGRTFNDGNQRDFFAGTNISSIVLEVPSSSLGSNIGIWATASRLDDSGNLVQVDRMGRPAINTALISPENKDAFNAGDPIGDARFREDARAHIMALGGDPDLANILLPDLLTVDTMTRTQFLNGRNLDDDVIDAELSLLTKGALTGDGIDRNDKDFLAAFPYLAEPHT